MSVAASGVMVVGGGDNGGRSNSAAMGGHRTGHISLCSTSCSHCARASGVGAISGYGIEGKCGAGDTEGKTAAAPPLLRHVLRLWYILQQSPVLR